ncbi:MAG TPA: putative Ig domain-containing protein [Opitutaceae bacterium]|nr:putative Ig domain-containing protein [Opitutaceae bacterium]
MKIQRPLISAVFVLAAGGLAGQGVAPTPQAPAPQATAAAILTPPPPPTPRINGPAVFGVRPGSPFLFSVPASGSRPMRFSAANLPAGLALDPATGRITGRLDSPGEFIVTLRAENALGADERRLRLVSGQAIALTPPLGWNSWNCWGKEVSQEKVLRSARAMVAAGLDQHGWTYINIDDGWQGLRGGPLGALGPNEKFPDMAALAGAIHAMGLKFGIYSTPWTKSYAGFLGGSAETPDGRAGASFQAAAPRNQGVLPYAVGRYSFAGQDARQWAAWGVDYLKYDWGPVDAANTAAMAAALRSTGRDIVLSLSNNSAGNILGIIGGLAPLAQSWRTTHDINDKWSRVVGIGFSQGPWAQYQSPGHYNDADMLVIGHVGWGAPHPTNLTSDEQYSHISLWCLLGTPLLIGCDLEKLDPFTIGLLTNDEVLAVDQDPLCRPATQVSGEGDLRVYAKPLEDGSWAVGLFNLGPNGATVTARWPDLGTSGPHIVRDLWRQRDLGTFGSGYGALVAPHGVVLLRVSNLDAAASRN